MGVVQDVTVRLFVTIALLCVALPASAQNPPVKQSGNVTPGHSAVWTTNGIIQDGGTAAQGNITSLGVTASGPGICQTSGPISGPYNQICLNVTQTGGGFLSLYNNNGATGGFSFVLNNVPLTILFANTCVVAGCIYKGNGSLPMLPSALVDNGTTVSSGETISIAPPSNSVVQGLLVSQSSPANNTPITGPVHYNEIDVTANADVGGADDRQVGIWMQFNTGGTNQAGRAIGAFFNMNHNSASTSGGDHIAGVASSTTSVTDTSGGQVYGWNAVCVATSTAHGIGCVSQENDLEVDSGANFTYGYALRLVNQGASRATNDAAIALASTNGGGSFAAGMYLSTEFGVQPIASTGSVISDDGHAQTVASVLNLPNVTCTANVINTPNYVVTCGGVEIAAASAAPSAPSAGVKWWADSTNNIFSSINASGTKSNTVVPQSGATSNQWLTYIDNTGVQHLAQPAFSNLSGSVSAGQMPALTGDVTSSAGSVATTIASNAVTNAKAAQMAANTCKSNITGSTANASDNGCVFARVTSNFNVNTQTSLQNVTGLSATLSAGITYGFHAHLYTTPNSTGGEKAGVGTDGTLSATDLRFDCVDVVGASRVLSAVTSAGSLSSFGACSTGDTGYSGGSIEIRGTITVNAGGVMSVQYAQNTSNAGNSTVLRGSTLEVWQIN